MPFVSVLPSELFLALPRKFQWKSFSHEDRRILSTFRKLRGPLEALFDVLLCRRQVIVQYHQRRAEIVTVPSANEQFLTFFHYR